MPGRWIDEGVVTDLLNRVTGRPRSRSRSEELPQGSTTASPPWFGRAAHDAAQEQPVTPCPDESISSSSSSRSPWSQELRGMLARRRLRGSSLRTKLDHKLAANARGPIYVAIEGERGTLATVLRDIASLGGGAASKKARRAGLDAAGIRLRELLVSAAGILRGHRLWQFEAAPAFRQTLLELEALVYSELYDQLMQLAEFPDRDRAFVRRAELLSGFLRASHLQAPGIDEVQAVDHEASAMAAASNPATSGARVSSLSPPLAAAPIPPQRARSRPPPSTPPPAYQDARSPHRREASARAAFDEAREALRRMHSCRSPRGKIECLALVSRSLCRALERHQGGSQQHQYGADDLLPCMILLVLRSCPPWFDSDLRFIDTFSDPAALRGEAGYLLTMAASAKSFVERLDASDLAGVSPESFASAVAEQEARGAVWEEIQGSDDESDAASESDSPAGDRSLSSKRIPEGTDGLPKAHDEARPQAYHEAWLALYDSAEQAQSECSPALHDQATGADEEQGEASILRQIQEAFPEVPRPIVKLLFEESNGNPEAVIHALLQQTSSDVREGSHTHERAEVQTGTEPHQGPNEEHGGVSFHTPGPAPGSSQARGTSVGAEEDAASTVSTRSTGSMLSIYATPEAPAKSPTKALEYDMRREHVRPAQAKDLDPSSSAAELKELGTIFPHVGKDVLECALLSQGRSMDRAVELLLSL